MGTISNHKLSVENEYLLVMMNLCMSIPDIELAEIPWINYLCSFLGSLKIWPTRDIIFQNAPRDFT